VSDENESWLPNLVGGVSIWKLAPDLNEEQFFGGRLLVPETEGSDSLPVRVEWDLTGLVPLPEARAKHAERVEQAIGEFFACLERTAKVFEKGGSGYDRYKSAFTVPALDADGGAHYFFSPRDGQLKVINWGASPRKIRHDKHYLFGYQEFAALIRKEQEGGGGAAVGALGAAMAAGATAEASGPDAPDGGGGASEDAKKDGKDDEKKDEGEEEKGALWGKPWWMWVLYLVGLLFLIGLIFAILRECQGPQGGASGVDGGARAMDGAVASDAGIETPIYGHASDDGGPPATELHGDGGASASDGGAGAGADGGAATDAGAGSGGGEGSGGEGSGGEGSGGEGSGGEGSGGEGSGGEGGGGSGGGGSGGGGSGGGGSGGGGSGGGGSGGGGSEAPPRNEDGEPIYGEVRTPSGGVVYWAPGEGGRAVQLPHRQYFHPDAQQWRIVGGTRKIYDYSGAGSNFSVFLRPGESFDGVRVQWRDGRGTWHDH
jgi:hypothetical protein